MKTRVCISTALIALAVYLPSASWSADTSQEMTDEQAVQALRDLGLPPNTILEMVKSELRDSLQNNASSDTDPDNPGTTLTSGSDTQVITGSSTATSASADVTDEQAAQTLRDLGLPPRVILGMIRKKLLESNGVDAAPAAPAPSSQAALYGSSVPASTVAAPEVQTIDDFRAPLAPHGAWITLEPYGLVWQPMVTIINSSWRPYLDDGTWEWTTDGWCWRSRYSWGWATFHYGRWAYVTGHRWVWIPDTVWAPSWVQWRYSDSYVGWAPLPPEACYNRGVGFSYRGSQVSIDCSFGLNDWHYSFVPAAGFAGRDPCRVAIPRRDARKIYFDTVSVRTSHTTRNNVALPTLPREIASNAGRRTDNLLRIVGHGSAEPVNEPSVQPTRTVIAPRSSAGRSDSVTTIQTYGSSAPSQVHSYAKYWPDQDATTVERPETGPDRRTSSLLDIFRHKTQNNVPAAVVPPAPYRQVPQAVNQPRSTSGDSSQSTAPVAVPSRSVTQESANPDRTGSRGDRLRSLLRDKRNDD